MIQLEIWSDLVCPFCYIGKRQLDAALERFEHRDLVQVEWKSFQLDPSAPQGSNLSTHEYLAGKYGRSIDWAKQMTAQVAERAEAVGLKFDFSKAVLTNTFDAHRLVRLASQYDLQSEAEEALFSAHFTEGKHIGEAKSLSEIGQSIGLDSSEIETTLKGTRFADEVRRDCDDAKSMGISGVPFFLVNRKYAISGAQPIEVFLNALQTAVTADASGDLCSDVSCET